MVEAGASALIVGRDGVALDRTANMAVSSGMAPMEPFVADLVATGSTDACVQRCIERFGQLDILVNCAGATKRGNFFNLSDEDWLDGYALKLHASVRLCRSAWPHLAARRGTVINIAGVGARTPTADFAIGASVNAALMSFGKSLAELGMAQGVRVNTINPGYIKSPRLERRLRQASTDRGVSVEDAERELLRDYGITRLGSPDDVAHLAVFMASDKGSYLQGAVVDLDGGATRGQ
jgi:3-oxoacyl-[acyl-carrier protein] reductase